MPFFSLPLALIVCLVGLRWLGVAMFGSGFFLTRTALTTRNECGSDGARRAEAQSFRPGLFSTSSDVCMYPAQFRKVVILVVDALRFDFVHSGGGGGVDGGGGGGASAKESPSRFYRGHLPLLSSLLVEQPQNSMLYRFEADAPTVTMQRLKALMTGSLPTFVDVADNYAAAAVPEDNLVAQLVAHNRSVVFVGDDTWHGLFGGQFLRSSPHPSFNVKDLHSNDALVMDVFPRELRRADWHLLIGHLLGVDHVGHRYGPSHIEMQHKLNSYNEFFAQTINALDDDTLLLIFGDHGMTERGDHGGATDDERLAALFAYSRRRLRFDIVYGMADDDDDDHAAWHVQQIDLVPTLALLLDLPIPFGNLGQIIPEFFVHAHNLTRVDVGHRWSTLNGAYAQNAGQVWHYLQQYQATVGGAFPEARFRALRDLYDDATATFYAAVTSDEQQNAATLYKRFLDEALAMCRQLWSTFDVPLMALGAAALAASAVVGALLALATTLQAAVDEPLLAASVAGDSWLAGLLLDALLGVVVSAVTLLLLAPAVDVRLLVGGAAVVALLATALRVLVTSAWSRVPWRSAALPGAWLALLVCALRGAGQFSNSYIEADADVLVFLLTTLLVAALAHGVRWRVRAEGLVAAGLCVVLVRVAGISATVHFKHDVTALEVGVFRAVALALVPIALLPAAGALLFARAATVPLSFVHPLAATSRAIGAMWSTGGTAARIALVQPLLLLCFAMLVLTGTAPLLHWAARIAVPQMMYASTAWALVTMARSSPPPTSAGDAGAAGGDASSDSKAARRAVVLSERVMRGSATLLLLLANVYVLVLGPMSALVAGLGVLVAPLLVRILLGARGVDDSSSSVTLALCLFGNLLFFATGHAYSFAALHVSAALVGFEEVQWTAGYALVLLNTFGSHVAPLLALPLVLTRAARRSELTHEQLNGALLTAQAFYAVQSALTAVFVFRERRHLMVWRVFAPKFVFDSAVGLVVDAVVLASLYALQRQLRK